MISFADHIGPRSTGRDLLSALTKLKTHVAPLQTKDQGILQQVDSLWRWVREATKANAMHLPIPKRTMMVIVALSVSWSGSFR